MERQKHGLFIQSQTVVSIGICRAERSAPGPITGCLLSGLDDFASSFRFRASAAGDASKEGFACLRADICEEKPDIFV